MNRRKFLKVVGLGTLALPFSNCFAADEYKSDSQPKPPAFKEQLLKPFTPGSWILAVLPDTQAYSNRYPGLFHIQTQWLVDNAKKYNIVYALTLGDITDNNTERQWNNANKAISRLDGVLPYTIVLGNHDYGVNGSTSDRSTLADNYFPPSRFKSWPTFGGVMEKGRIENNYHLFEAGGNKWLILNLEWGPRNKTLQWANKIITVHSNRKVIVTTHAYLYNDSTRYDWAAKGQTQRWNPHSYPSKDDTNDGEQMWQKMVKKHPNVSMVINGHVCNDGLGFQVSTANDSHKVNEMLVNYQILEYGGAGWLRLLEFLPDGKTIQVRDYTPLYEKFNTNPDNYFETEID
ncbi:MAG: metallophosphoesterase [Planctomycetota bacterium]|jgi:hypothetical protein